jgi:SAM-dependent methyltransferase
MSSTNYYPNYDLLAQGYNEVYAESLSEHTMSILEQLMLPYLPEAASILDLCCGTGQLAQKFLIKGYQITGIDRCEEMLRYARKNALGGKFILGDAYSFELPQSFQGVISMYALNYVMNLKELINIFQNVEKTLQKNGLFVFNLRLEEEFKLYWNGSKTRIIRDNYAWISHQIYNPKEKIGQIKITGFQRLYGNWKPVEQTLLEKSYSCGEIESSLKSVGFKEVNIHYVKNDLSTQETSEYTYFVSRK